MKEITINCEFEHFLCKDQGRCWIPTTLNLADEEAQLFVDALDKFKECNPDELKNVNTDYGFFPSGIYAYLFKVLPFALEKKITGAVGANFIRTTLGDLLENCPYVYENDIEENSEISKEQWQRLSFDEKFDLLLKCNPYLSDLSTWEFLNAEICK